MSICVPTPLRQTGDPDMSYIISAAEELARYAHREMVVVLESTTYPGTTRELVLPEAAATCRTEGRRRYLRLLLAGAG